MATSKIKSLRLGDGDLDQKSQKVTSRKEVVNAEEMTVFATTFYGAAALEVAAGTNCPQGGDGGHGGRTLVEFRDLGSTDIKASPPDDGNAGVRIELGGDSECEVMSQALAFAAAILRHQVKANKTRSQSLAVRDVSKNAAINKPGSEL